MFNSKSKLYIVMELVTGGEVLKKCVCVCVCVCYIYTYCMYNIYVRLYYTYIHMYNII